MLFNSLSIDEVIPSIPGEVFGFILSFFSIISDLSKKVAIRDFSLVSLDRVGMGPSLSAEKKTLLKYIFKSSVYQHLA